MDFYAAAIALGAVLLLDILQGILLAAPASVLMNVLARLRSDSLPNQVHGEGHRRASLALGGVGFLQGLQIFFEPRQ